MIPGIYKDTNGLLGWGIGGNVFAVINPLNYGAVRKYGLYKDRGLKLSKPKQFIIPSEAFVRGDDE